MAILMQIPWNINTENIFPKWLQYQESPCLSQRASKYIWHEDALSTLSILIQETEWTEPRLSNIFNIFNVSVLPSGEML